jgi:small subunit ribosomal protein S1
MKEGDIVSGAVRSLASYGAFVDLGGIDALLHISDIAWSR